VFCFTNMNRAPVTFGDALNLWLWDKLLPQAGSVLRPDLIFLGIGTLLNNKLPPGPKLVFGAGAGYGPAPKPDATWDIRFVRGLDSAVALGLPASSAILDPGAAVGLILPRETQFRSASLMPRFDSMTRELTQRCAEADVHLIDPRDPVEKILPQIATSQLVLSECLHGAVVADALRIPWIPVVTADRNQSHAFKWRDWLSIFGMDYNPVSLERESLGYVVRHAAPRRTNSKLLKVQMLRFITELQKLRTEINTRTGPFAIDKEAHA